MITLFKAIKALFRFIREMWLRDRTFRQFVRSHLSLIVMTIGFVSMTLMFTHVYFIVIEQEDIISDGQDKIASLQKQVDDEIPFLKERLEWYREHRNTSKDSLPPTREHHVPIVPDPGPSTPVPAPLKPEPKMSTSRPPNNDLVERWKKLSQ